MKSSVSMSCNAVSVMLKVAVWLSGNALALINVVALRRARLNTILVFNQVTQAYSAWPSLRGYAQ